AGQGDIHATALVELEAPHRTTRAAYVHQIARPAERRPGVRLGPATQRQESAPELRVLLGRVPVMADLMQDVPALPALVSTHPNVSQGNMPVVVVHAGDGKAWPVE